MLLHAWLCVIFSLSLSIYIYICIYVCVCVCLLLILLRDHVRFLRDGLDGSFSTKNLKYFLIIFFLILQNKSLFITGNKLGIVIMKCFLEIMLLKSSCYNQFVRVII